MKQHVTHNSCWWLHWSRLCFLSTPHSVGKITKKNIIVDELHCKFREDLSSLIEFGLRSCCTFYHGAMVTQNQGYRTVFTPSDVQMNCLNIKNEFNLSTQVQVSFRVCQDFQVVSDVDLIKAHGFTFPRQWGQLPAIKGRSWEARTPYRKGKCRASSVNMKILTWNCYLCMA